MSKNNYRLCVCCKGKEELMSIPCFRRGGKPFMVCKRCLVKLAKPQANNPYVDGKVKSHGSNFSLSLGVVNYNEFTVGEFMGLNHYIVKEVKNGRSFVSPRYEGLDALKMQLVTLDRMQELGNVLLNGSSVLHVGNINLDTNQVKEFSNEILGEFKKVLRENEEIAKRIFGCIPTIRIEETKLGFTMKYMNHKQYMEACKLCKKVIECIVKNFNKHYNDSRDNIQSYRLHKASVTSKKLVEILCNA